MATVDWPAGGIVHRETFPVKWAHRIVRIVGLALRTHVTVLPRGLQGSRAPRCLYIRAIFFVCSVYLGMFLSPGGVVWVKHQSVYHTGTFGVMSDMMHAVVGSGPA